MEFPFFYHKITISIFVPWCRQLGSENKIYPWSENYEWGIILRNIYGNNNNNDDDDDDDGGDDDDDDDGGDDGDDDGDDGDDDGDDDGINTMNIRLILPEPKQYPVQSLQS